MTRASVLWVLGTLLIGCGPALTNGGLTCSDDGKCPPGYHCATTNTCWKNGQDPTDGGVDLSVADLSANEGMDLAGQDIKPTLTNGQLCSSKLACKSGNCADGVCCDDACTESCKSCNQPTSLGVCTAIGNGSNPAHGTCGPDAKASCMRDGTCDGNGACRNYDSTTVCLDGSCSPTSNMNTGDSKCDGAGKCVAPTAISCAPYVCNTMNTACFASCSAPAQCFGAMPCNENQCGPKTLGTPCGGDGECATMNCVDSVCCDTAATSCNGCKQCDLASSLGKCANVPTNQDRHGSCAANPATCTAGGCTNGACTPAATNVQCSSACTPPNTISITKCNGVSTGCTNAGAVSSCPGDTTCANATSCNASCSADGDSDCVSTDYCAAGNCTTKLGTGVPCTANDQCSSGACTAFHRDADGDTFGATAPTMFCGTTPPSGYVTNNMDCCDGDSNVHPGQLGWFPTPANAACGSNFFDYDCDGTPVSEYGAGGCTTSGACTLANPSMCNFTAGFEGTVPGCGAMGAYVTACGKPTTCGCGATPGECGSICGGTPTAISMPQPCH